MKIKRIFIFMLFLFSFILVSCSGSSSSNNDGETTDATATTGKCGDGTLNKGEVCDSKKDSETYKKACWELGHYYPDTFAKCKSDCSGYDLKNCIKRPDSDKCGNGKKEEDEVCEMGETKDCSAFGDHYKKGSKAPCNRTCMGWDLSKCEPEPNDTCAQIFSCYSNCKDAGCQDQCKADGKPSEVDNFEALWKCYTSSCSSASDSKQCMKEKCESTYYVCFPSEKCGNGKIDEGETCEKGDTKPCEKVDSKFRPMNTAICNSTCSGYDTYSCIGKDQLDCYMLYDCIKKCSGDSSCETTCQSKAFAKAGSLYNTLKTCISKNCPDKNETCIDEKCKYQFDACKTQLTCGNKIIDKPFEVCEKGDKVDCGTIKDKEGKPKFEKGTANAFCNNNCTGWTELTCHGFCSCGDVQKCIEDTCQDGEKTTDYDCIAKCETAGSSEGSSQYKAWRKFILGCSYDTNNDGKADEAGFDSPNCIKKANQDIGCDSNNGSSGGECKY